MRRAFSQLLTGGGGVKPDLYSLRAKYSFKIKYWIYDVVIDIG